MRAAHLSLQDGLTNRPNGSRMVVLGEVLWDLLPDHTCLGGAPLNFAVHASRLGFEPLLISAVGEDDLGRQATHMVEQLGLSIRMLRTTARWPTGTASVKLDSAGDPTFLIGRPAAYDAVSLTGRDLEQLSALAPAWLYYGTLFPSTAEGKATLLQVMDALPSATRFYDVNLRPGFDSPDLMMELLARAGVVKMNEHEMSAVSQSSGLPGGLEEFCFAAADRFGWRAVCVTLGERGCAVLAGSDYTVAAGYPITVADSVGAGDAFAAAFLHGLEQQWQARRIAEFANRVGAVVASRVGATPNWNVAEMAEL